MKRNKYCQQVGFTLIELIIVIILLGILAVVAAPKFVTFTKDAKTQSLHAVKAAMGSAVELVYSKSAIKGNQNITTSSATHISINGKVLAIKFGTPLANYTNVPPSRPATWDDLITIDVAVYSKAIINGHLVIYYESDGMPKSFNAPCLIDYKQVANVGERPIITVRECE